jgi:hypothetical protein
LRHTARFRFRARAWQRTAADTALTQRLCAPGAQAPARPSRIAQTLPAPDSAPILPHQPRTERRATVTAPGSIRARLVGAVNRSYNSHNATRPPGSSNRPLDRQCMHLALNLTPSRCRSAKR